MFKTRLISGIILVILAALCFYFGGVFLICATGIISLIGMYELYRAIGIEKSDMAYFAYVESAWYFLNLYMRAWDNDRFFVIILLIAILFDYVFTYPKYNASQVMTIFFGFFYVSVTLSHIYLVRELPRGIYLVWLILLCSWGADTCAYCAGRLFGRHKMAPVLSPKKTVEGAIGGLAGVFILTFIYCYLLRDAMDIQKSHIVLISLAAMACGFISMVGDLAASAIKRNYDIKDYGSLIPGHGGILDRFDSVIITAPVLYYLMVLIIG